MDSYATFRTALVTGSKPNAASIRESGWGWTVKDGDAILLGLLSNRKWLEEHLI